MRKPATILAALGVGLTAALLGATPAFAVPITYTEQAVASGSLDGVAFTDAAVVLTMTNDTGNVTGSAPIFTNSGTSTVSVAGGAPETFTNTTLVFSNQNTPAVGFATESVDILDDVSASFATYDLTTAIGPIVGTPIFDAGGSFDTNSGAFILNSVPGNVTFTATLAAVPEPSALALLAVGLAGLFGVARRRQNS
ncbi:MAG: PEP-CTERM sorting domain-containing protein [Stellaceae bacterium]